MKFEEALQILRDGGKVRRPSMAHTDSISIALAANGFLMRQATDTGYNYLQISLYTEDLLAEDWEAVE